MLHTAVPDSYQEFLRRTNGLDWNGTVFFASETSPYYDDPNLFLEGLVEENLRLREVPANAEYLIFGESGMEMYLLDIGTGSYNIVDHISLEVFESFGSFEEMFVAALTKRLLPNVP